MHGRALLDQLSDDAGHQIDFLSCAALFMVATVAVSSTSCAFIFRFSFFISPHLSVILLSIFISLRSAGSGAHEDAEV